MLILGLFTMFYYANTLKIIEFLHLFCFDLITHVDIGLHRLIITVTCPFMITCGGMPIASALQMNVLRPV